MIGDHICPICGAQMVLRRSGNLRGKFYACNRFECPGKSNSKPALGTTLYDSVMTTLSFDASALLACTPDVSDLVNEALSKKSLNQLLHR